MASRRLQTYATEAITVTFDPTRCIHAAECIRAQPLVFDSTRKRWIKLELGAPEDIATAIRRCPTGALHYQLAGGSAEAPDASLSLRAARNGPLYVRGDVRLERDDGTLIAEGYRMALCRCGATQNAPFCDGSHRTVGFRDAAVPIDTAAAPGPTPNG
jgi:uncharacterized Fe-S cluster protein YjdI/CDGSH-type Zn-finger protein